MSNKSVAEYYFELTYKDLENILLQREQDLNTKFQFQYSGDSARLSSTELSCLLFTANNDFWWLLDKEVDIKLKNNYKIEIKDQSGNTLFRERARLHNGKPAILVETYGRTTIEAIARDLLRDIIPSKGSLSPKQRLWN